LRAGGVFLAGSGAKFDWKLALSASKLTLFAMEPSPASEEKPLPGVTDERSGRGSEVSWIMLCTVMFLPLWLVVGLLWSLGQKLVVLLSDPYAESSAVNFFFSSLFGTFAVSIPLTVYLSRLGLRRGWNSAKVLRRGWGLATLMITLLMVGGILLVRTVARSSQVKGVLSNVRGLSAAADQYFLEYGGSTVAMANLVGATNYVKAINPIANERYPSYYTQGITITVDGVAGLRTVTYVHLGDSVTFRCLLKESMTPSSRGNLSGDVSLRPG